MPSPTVIALSIAHGLQRLAVAVVLPGARWAADRADPRDGDARASATGSARIAAALRNLKDRLGHGRTRMRVSGAASEADLVEARLMVEHWRARAESGEHRIADLEARLAASEMTALDLRSRLVCLHGKLATSTATARYQSLTLALEGHAAPPLPGRRLVADTPERSEA